jgi:hypothetical protein
MMRRTEVCSAVRDASFWAGRSVLALCSNPHRDLYPGTGPTQAWLWCVDADDGNAGAMV